MWSSNHKTKNWNIIFDLLGAPTNLVQVFLYQKPYDWQLLVAENHHNQENNNAGLAHEDVKYFMNLDSLVC